MISRARIRSLICTTQAVAVLAFATFSANAVSAAEMPPCGAPDIVKKLEQLYPNSLSDNGRLKGFRDFKEISTTDKPPQHFVDFYKSDTAAVVAAKYCLATVDLTKEQEGDYTDEAYVVILDVLNSDKDHTFVPDVCSRLFFRPDELTCDKHRLLPPGQTAASEPAPPPSTARSVDDELAEIAAAVTSKEPPPPTAPKPTLPLAKCDDPDVVKTLSLQYSMGEASSKTGGKFESFKDFQEKSVGLAVAGDPATERRYCEALADLGAGATDKVYFYVSRLVWPDGKQTFVPQSCSLRITTFSEDCGPWRPH